MGGVILPDRTLLTEPEVIEAYSGQEVPADGAVFRDTDEIVQLLVFLDRSQFGKTEHHETLRIHFRRSGFERLGYAVMAWMGGGTKH